MAEDMDIHLVGPTKKIAFPDLCACCGAPARDRIRIERAFEHWSHDRESYHWWTFLSLRVPFCAACTAQHRQQERGISLMRRLLLLFQTFTAIPMLGGTAFAGYFYSLGLAHPGSAVITNMAAGVFALIGLGAAWAGWRSTRHRAIPIPTAVTGSFLFTDDEAALLEPERHTFSLRNATFAAAFAADNQHRVWDPAGPQARRALRWRRVLWVLLALASLLLAIWDLWRRH
jgi:hypothetical protein